MTKVNVCVMEAAAAQTREHNNSMDQRILSTDKWYNIQGDRKSWNVQFLRTQKRSEILHQLAMELHLPNINNSNSKLWYLIPKKLNYTVVKSHIMIWRNESIPYVLRAEMSIYWCRYYREYLLNKWFLPLRLTMHSPWGYSRHYIANIFKAINSTVGIIVHLRMLLTSDCEWLCLHVYIHCRAKYSSTPLLPPETRHGKRHSHLHSVHYSVYVKWQPRPSRLYGEFTV